MTTDQLRSRLAEVRQDVDRLAQALELLDRLVAEGGLVVAASPPVPPTVQAPAAATTIPPWVCPSCGHRWSDHWEDGCAALPHPDQSPIGQVACGCRVVPPKDFGFRPLGT